MTTTLMLRIASIVAFLFALGHGLGGRESWSPIGETEVLRAMRTFTFDVAGTSRTYLDFYLGFGHSLTIFLALQAVLLWQLGRMAAVDARSVRPMVASLAIATLASGVVAWHFIFFLPAVFSAVLAAILVAAYVRAR